MLYRALIWRPLRRDAGRTLLSVLAIALGVAVVVAIRVANRSAVASFEQSTQQLAGGADLLVSGPAAITPEMLEHLRPLGAEAEITPYIERNGKIELELAALAEFVPHAGQAQAVAGVADLLANVATFDGLRVKVAPGVTVTSAAARLRALVPAADAVGPPEAVVEQATEMLAAFRANLAALSYVALLVGVFLIYNTVSISAVRRRMAIATARALGAARVTVLRLFIGEGAVLALVGGVLGVIAGWGLALGTLAMMQRTIANLYGAPGANAGATLTAGDIAWGLGLALAAGVVAAWAPARQAAGIRPAEALRAGGEERVARRHTGAWLWAAAGCGVVAAVAGVAGLHTHERVPWLGFLSALAAVLAWAALTPVVLGAALPRLRAWCLGRGHVAAGLAAGSLAGALRRSSILTAAVAMAIGVMLGVGIMVGSFRQTVAVWIGQQLRDDVYARSVDWDRTRPTGMPPQVVAALAVVPGAAAVAAQRRQDWTFRGLPIQISTHWSLRGVAASPQYQYLQGGPGAVIVSEPFARRFRVWTGGRFKIEAAREPLMLTVAGVFYDYSSERGLVVLDAETYARGWGTPQPTDIGLDAAPGVTAQGLLQRAGAVEGVVLHDNAGLRAEALRVFDQTFRITYALEAITLLVAILGVGNTLLAVVLERGRELALLRYLGSTRAQIRSMLVAEAAWVGTFALALGWGTGWVLSVILARVINVESFGWTIAFHAPVVFLAVASALVWVATVGAGWLPVRAAQQQAAPAGLGAE